jgi:hypothetical protein
MTAELDGTKADNWNVEVFGQNRVEFRDSTRPGIEVVTGDAIDHRVCWKLVR